MTKKNVVFILFLIFLFNSCIPTKAVKEFPKSQLTQLNYNNYQNVYCINPKQQVDNITGEPLDKFFFKPIKKYYCEEFREFDGKIELNFVSSKRLSCTFILNDSVTKKQVFRGKIKNGYFCFRRRVFFIGIPYIYFNYRRLDRYIGFDLDKNLIVRSKSFDLESIFNLSDVSKDVFGGDYDANCN